MRISHNNFSAYLKRCKLEYTTSHFTLLKLTPSQEIHDAARNDVTIFPTAHDKNNRTRAVYTYSHKMCLSTREYEKHSFQTHSPSRCTCFLLGVFQGWGTSTKGRSWSVLFFKKKKKKKKKSLSSAPTFRHRTLPPSPPPSLCIDVFSTENCVRCSSFKESDGMAF